MRKITSVRHRVLLALLTELLVLGPWSLHAQEAQPAEETEAPPPQTTGEVTLTEGEIATSLDDALSDEAIAARLEGIFDALPALSEIDVSVTQGVVRLTGVVVEADSVTRAETLASRIAGVVAVDNAITLETSVDKRLGPAAQRTRQVLQDTIAFLPLLVIAFLTAVLFWLFGIIISRQRWFWSRVTPNPLIGNLVKMLVPIVFGLLGVVIALNILDAIAVLSAVLGAAGVLGLAVGFAVKDTIENFISSVMLSLRQPFRANDLVEIGDITGNVVRLTSRATILMTPDGNHVRIPNAKVFNEVITNYTRNPERRITFELGIDAEDDPLAAIDTGLEALRQLDFVIPDPPPAAWIKLVGDSNIVLIFAPWIDQAHTDFQKAKSAAIRAVKIRLETQGFTLPEPIYRLRIDGTVPQIPQSQPAERKPTNRVTTATIEEADTSPDNAIEKKVHEDRAEAAEGDLLSPDAPTEFGDKGEERS